MLDCPILGTQNERRTDTLTTRLFLDDQGRKPGGGLGGVDRLKEMNRHHPDHVPMLILADEHHRARSRMKFLDASRNLGGISRIPQLF